MNGPRCQHENCPGKLCEECGPAPTVERGEVGWTTTASVDYGSGRPPKGTPREAMPHARHCTTEDEPGTASSCMLVQPRGSLDLFEVVRQGRLVGASALNVSRTGAQSPGLDPQLMTARMEVDLSRAFGGGAAERVRIKNAPAARGT